MHQLPNTKKPTRNELVFYVIFYFFNLLFLEYQEAKDLKTHENLEAKIYFIIQIYFKNKIFSISFSYFLISLSSFKFD